MRTVFVIITGIFLLVPAVLAQDSPIGRDRITMICTPDIGVHYHDQAPGEVTFLATLYRGGDDLVLAPLVTSDPRFQRMLKRAGASGHSVRVEGRLVNRNFALARNVLFVEVLNVTRIQGN